MKPGTYSYGTAERLREGEVPKRECRDQAADSTSALNEVTNAPVSAVRGCAGEAKAGTRWQAASKKWAAAAQPRPAQKLAAGDERFERTGRGFLPVGRRAAADRDRVGERRPRARRIAAIRCLGARDEPTRDRCQIFFGELGPVPVDKLAGRHVAAGPARTRSATRPSGARTANSRAASSSAAAASPPPTSTTSASPGGARRSPRRRRHRLPRGDSDRNASRRRAARFRAASPGIEPESAVAESAHAGRGPVLVALGNHIRGSWDWRGEVVALFAQSLAQFLHGSGRMKHTDQEDFLAGRFEQIDVRISRGRRSGNLKLIWRIVQDQQSPLPSSFASSSTNVSPRPTNRRS